MKERIEKIKRWLQFFGKRLSNLFFRVRPGESIIPPKIDKTNSLSTQITGDKELFVVWDAIGDGRVVGVFSKESLAVEIREINPYYFRYYRCRLDLPAENELEWLDDDQKWQLERLRIKYGLPQK